MAAYFLALDAGTGSGRAVIYDEHGREVGIGQKEWVHVGDPAIPGALDFDCMANGKLLDEVTRAALFSAGIDGRQIKAVATTSMREGTVWFGADGEVLWACPNTDSRATAESDALTADGSAARIFEIAGDWVSITTPARVKWMARNRPDILDRTRHIGLISDWAATRLTGNYFTEPSAGSSTGLFDLSRRNWSDELFSLLELDKSIFPEVSESGEQIGVVGKAAAERTGLPEGTPVIAGGGDTQLALVGLGRRVGDSTLVGGTFWQMTQLLDRPIIDPARGPRTLCHARPGQWMIEGIGFLTGFSMRWLRDMFFEADASRGRGADGDIFSIMEKLAERQPVGSNGVQAIVSSIMQSDGWIHASPTLLGFNLMDAERIGKGAVVRAVMEAGAYVSLSHRRLVEGVTEHRADSLCFTGGSARGRLWPQIIADVMGLPVQIPEVVETTALGCAILAAIGSGHYSSLEEATPMTSRIGNTIEPDPTRVALYQELHSRWLEVDRAMVDIARRGLTTPMWKAAGGIYAQSCPTRGAQS